MGVNGLLKKVLAEAGIRPERFNLQWASAAEAPRFVKLITEFTKKIQSLGPLGAAEGLKPDEVKVRLDKALAVVSDMKVRVAFGNVTKALRKEGSAITEAMIAERIDEKMSKSIAAGLGG
jgi:hypothetical protein